MRAVLDANVFISSLINPDSPPAKIFLAWQAGQFELVLSDAVFAEWREVVDRPEASAFFRRSREGVARLLEEIEEAIEFVDPVVLAVIENDPDDDLVLGTALAGEADYIVSGDKHLLGLGGTYEGIQIVTPRQFLVILEAADHLP